MRKSIIPRHYLSGANSPKYPKMKNNSINCDLSSATQILIDIFLFSLFAHCIIFLASSLKANNPRDVLSDWDGVVIIFAFILRGVPPRVSRVLYESIGGKRLPVLLERLSSSRTSVGVASLPSQRPEWRGVARQATESRGTKRLFCFSRRRLRGRLKFLLSFRSRLEEIHIWIVAKSLNVSLDFPHGLYILQIQIVFLWLFDITADSNDPCSEQILIISSWSFHSSVNNIHFN